MKELSKKRTKAILIDTVIATAVSIGIETALKSVTKKNRSAEAVYATLLPTFVMWGMEAIQMKNNGQTLGYKAVGLKLETEDGQNPSCEQVLKRAVYRDMVSTFDYLKDRKGFEGKDGSAYPHDQKFGTVVREVN
ncbi:RDD family protein [Chryseomicrobium palamuruense]|uniref:RDD family protein n=1 Tax=Chryseomicrobium palamuruense TaxID=682973 RepID=A0ABV8UUH1_9BACL